MDFWGYRRVESLCVLCQVTPAVGVELLAWSIDDQSEELKDVLSVFVRWLERRIVDDGAGMLLDAQARLKLRVVGRTARERRYSDLGSSS